MRNMKMLGLLAIAAMALAAFVGTSAASAEELFTADATEETIVDTTEEDHVFTITGSKVECDTADFTGETEGTKTTTQVVTPEYTGCDAFGFEDVGVVDTNTCEYLFSSTTSGEEGHADVTLKGCEDSTEGITITVNLTPFAHCAVDVPEQTIETAVSYDNPDANTMSVEATADEIMVDVTESAGFCPLTEGTHSGGNGGTYDGLSHITTANGVQYSE